MKAACVLVCLALAHGITGSIFKQVERRVDGFDVKKLVYIDQYQPENQDRSSEGQTLWDQTVQGQKYRDQPESQKYRDQPENQKYRDQPESQKYRDQPESQKYRDQPESQKLRDQQLWKQKYWQQPGQEQNNQEQNYQERDQQYQPYQYPLHQHHHEKKRQHSSSENNQESKDTTILRYYANQKPTLSDDNQKWSTHLYKSVMHKENESPQAYGDAIVWRGLQMAIGPNAPIQTEEDIEKIFGDAQKAMKHIPEGEKAKFHEVYELVKQEENEDAHLNATELAQKYLYPVEEYTVSTEDGYILTLFRIPPKKQIRDVQKRPVVFLMHGILGSADDWLLMGPEKSLAYLLSDAGYDVWLGNARGNKYSRRHVSKHPAMVDFWQYSIDEIALHDLPAMIDFALETTKQEKLYYIGHAQGTTAFFALTATRPEYNDKIIMMYALSPMVYMTNVRSPLLRMIAPTSKFQERLQIQFGNGAFTPSKEVINTVGGAMCENEIGCKMVCSNVNFVMAGVNVDGLDYNMIPVVMGHLPAGTSTKVIKHFGQGVTSNEFRRFDYGSQINEQVYGMLEPPTYNMSDVQAPVTLYYSEEDWLAHPKDVVRLQNVLPNVKEAFMVPEEHFSHMDFQFSTKATEIVYSRLIDSMEKLQ